MTERTERLRALMQIHKLGVADVAALLQRKPQLVRHWRCGYRVIPADALALLEMRVTCGAA